MSDDFQRDALAPLMCPRHDCESTRHALNQLRVENKHLRASFEAVKQQRDEAIAMLADWCLRVDKIGTGWDDWDEGYKNAMYRPCGIRELIDAAKKELEPQYER